MYSFTVQFTVQAALCLMFILFMTITPTLGMICLLMIGLIFSSLMFMLVELKVGVLVMVLVVVGGLFVLMSFVILSMPWDFSKIWGAGSVEWLIGASLIVGVGGYGCQFCVCEKESFSVGKESVFMVSSEYSVGFMFLIIFLLLSLAIFNVMVKSSGGSSFGKI